MKNSLREKLARGETLFGTQTFLGSKEVASIFGSVGYDFVFICAEHPAYGADCIFDLVKYCEAAGTPALVRLPELDVTFTKKVLDGGVSAVLFPMVHNAKEVSAVTDVCLYPPYGKRGFGPMGAVRWGIDGEKDFVAENLNGTLRLIQIEHIDAVNDLENIVKNPYIDGYVFGPNDLASSIGHICDMYHPSVIKEVKRAVKVLNDNGKTFGVSLASLDKEKIAFWKELGARIFSLGADTAFVREGAVNEYNDLKNLIYKK